MKLFDPILAWLAPHDCLGCNAEGALLCTGCRTALPPATPQCYKCQMACPDSTTCASCAPTSPLYAVYAAVAYRGTAKAAVWKLKFGRCQSAGRELAAIMTIRLTLRRRLAGGGRLIVTHAPTATSRVRQRGYDQAQLIAKALAADCGLPYRPLLARTGRQEQIGASRAQRTAQLTGAFRARSGRAVRGAHILLVDDVITTGATLESAATALRAAGARRVDAIVFAQA